jgi:hypothetical protein
LIDITLSTLQSGFYNFPPEVNSGMVSCNSNLPFFAKI